MRVYMSSHSKNLPLSFKMESLTTLSQPVQHIRTFSSTVCQKSKASNSFKNIEA